MFSLSSPPQSTSIHTPHPQQHQYTFRPQTPSPLRTSRNANLMPPIQPPQSKPRYSGSKSSPILSAGASSSITTTTTNTSSSSSSLLFTPGDGGNAASVSSRSFTEPPRADKQRLFRYQARSRGAQSPQVRWMEKMSEIRAERWVGSGSWQRRREEERWERRAEQVLRMDFVKERREWEEELRARAEVEGVRLEVEDEDQEMGIGLDVSNKDEDDVAAADVPSPTEEREIEALLEYLDQNPSWGDSRQSGRCQDNQQGGLYDNMSDDEDYDQLFMEVIGASQGQGQEHEQRHPTPTGSRVLMHPPAQGACMEMDLS